MNILKKLKHFFMSSESIRQEVDCKFCDKLSEHLKADKNSIQKWEEKNLLISPIFQRKLWNSAFFLIQNGYRLETPPYLNTSMREKALAVLWMNNQSFYAMLSVSTPALLNHQDKNGNTILHALDEFDYHMQFRNADVILSRITDMMTKGADSTIKNQKGALPLQKIIQNAGFSQKHSVCSRFLKAVQQQREHIKA